MDEYKSACSTKAKREAMARQVEMMAVRYGATAERRIGLWGPKAFDLTLALGDHRVMMTFNGASNVGAFLGHWYTEGREARYPLRFAGAIQGSVNTITFAKATSIENSFDAFLLSLECGLEFLIANVISEAV
jgi:hypothetical protein